jgi:hypothetical protein
MKVCSLIIAALNSGWIARKERKRDKALKVFLQNLLDSMLIAFMWGFSRWWSVRVD